MRRLNESLTEGFEVDRPRDIFLVCMAAHVVVSGQYLIPRRACLRTAMAYLCTKCFFGSSEAIVGNVSCSMFSSQLPEDVNKGKGSSNVKRSQVVPGSAKSTWGSSGDKSQVVSNAILICEMASLCRPFSSFPQVSNAPRGRLIG